MLVRGDERDPYLLLFREHRPADGDPSTLTRPTAQELAKHFTEGCRGEAVDLVMTEMGMPPEAVEGMRQTPRWAELEAYRKNVANGEVDRHGS
jgi:hypothetical protein